MDLSPEDQLRLNVLLAHEPQAIRIDEQAMTVHALAREGEACIPLNPNCRAEQYLRRVRELLSYHALGSPGGYPVFLQRWTRMGQHREGQLDKLLLLGEPEAVVAVAGAPGLTGELARRVWWLMPESDVARRMLEREGVAHSELGRTVATHLVEHLAFETEPMTVVQTIRLVLQPGLIGEETRRKIWARGNHRNAFHLGFLEADPDRLPGRQPARAQLAPLAAAGNAPAALLTRLLDAAGQSFLAVSEDLLRYPVDKYTVAHLLNLIGAYFAPARSVAKGEDALALVAAPQPLLEKGGAELATLWSAAPALRRETAAMVALALTHESLVATILARTTATGTLLKRKLEPVTDLLLAHYAVLRGTTA